MKKRLFSSLCMIFFALCFLNANGNENVAQDTLTTWQNLLDYAKNHPHKENEGDLSHLRLTNYTYKGTIKSAIDKSKIIDSLLSCNAPIAMHLPPIIIKDTTLVGDSYAIQEKSFPKFEIVTICKLVEIAETKGEENPIILMSQELGERIKVGMEYLELEWNYKGNKIHSLCIVSNERSGIVYEPITINLTTSITYK